jgi:hypothetical protein
MLALRALRLRPITSSIAFPHLNRHPPWTPPSLHLRQKATVQKKKGKPGQAPEESAYEVRARLRAKARKAKKKRIQKFQRLQAARAAIYKLPPWKPREDCVPFGTAMNLLRGFGAKLEIFGKGHLETEVWAIVRAVPNAFVPKEVRGVVALPNPVGNSEEVLTKKMAVILAEGEDRGPAKSAGMIIGDKEYLNQVQFGRENC